MTERYVHAAQVAFPGAAERAEERLFAVVTSHDAETYAPTPFDGRRGMAFARVATFEGVTVEHVDGLRKRIEESGQPEGMNATEFLVLFDPGTGKSVSIVLFDTMEDYEKGNAILDGVNRDDAPGARTSVERFEVPIRMTA